MPLRAHPLFVYSTCVVILVGFVLEMKPFFESPRPQPARLAARWCLWIGAGGLLVSVLTGFLQPGKSVVLEDVSGPFLEHRFLGIWTAIVFVGISLGRFLAGRRANALLVLVWLSALWLLGVQVLAGRRLGGTDSHEMGEPDGPHAENK